MRSFKSSSSLKKDVNSRNQGSLQNDHDALQVLKEYQETFGNEASTTFVGYSFKRDTKTLKRTNVFQDNDDDQVKKPVLRDPRKLKFMTDSISKSVAKVVEKEESNVLRLQNVSNSLNEVTICQMFCMYGPVYSCRLIRDQNMAYVAFTKVDDAKDALENLNGQVFDGQSIKLSYAPKILCSGHVLLKSDQVNQVTGLPFNAQYDLLADRSRKKTKVVVKIPSADIRKIIHQTIQLVFKYGTDFEMQLIKKEKGNPKYDFLTNYCSMEHAYYRWKVYSLKNGDLPNWWTCHPFEMFEDGSTWFPPKIPFEEKKLCYPESLEYDSAASESSDSGSDEDGQKKKYSSKLTQMSFYHRTCFEDKLRNLTTYRGDIAEAMIFCMRHSYAAEELASLISDSLMIDETDVYPTKVARLYLLSDILFNASSIPRAWKFRTAFEPHLPAIFAVFGKIAKSIPGLIRQDRFRAKVTSTITAWEKWVIFPSDYTDRLWQSYKTASVKGESLESRMQFQKENKIGLYSPEYESREKSMCIDVNKHETETLPDVLPVGFKKTNSWISIDHNAESDILPVAATQNQDAKPEESDEEDIDGAGEANEDCQGDEDIDGEPLSKTHEESEEDIDGEPLSKTHEESEDEESDEEDIDGEPLASNRPSVKEKGENDYWSDWDQEYKGKSV